MAALIGAAATLPVRWSAGAERAWSYGVYCLGYRLLSIQMSCGYLAVGVFSLVMKHA
jgi:hypothetical protein